MEPIAYTVAWWGVNYEDKRIYMYMYLWTKFGVKGEGTLLLTRAY